MDSMKVLKELFDDYGLTTRNVADLVGKTEATLKKDLDEGGIIGRDLRETLLSPLKLLNLVKTTQFTPSKTKYSKAIQKIQAKVDSEYERIIGGKAFVKMVKRNELGYRKGDEIGAGSFILIPKNCVKGFFPDFRENPLEVYIPGVGINVRYHSYNYEDVLIKGVHQIPFEYQNGKLHDAEADNHNEYRLYTVRSGVKVNPNDLVIMTGPLGDDKIYDLSVIHWDDKKNRETYDEILRIVDDRKSGTATAALVPIYELVKKGISLPDISWVDYYNDCDDAISNDSLKEGIVDEALLDNGHWVLDESNVNQLLGNALIQEDIETVQRTVKTIIRDSKFRETILSQYGCRCAVTGHSLVYRSKACLQGCHIIPRKSGGGDTPTNGICLEYNMHWLFDEGFFTLTQDYKIEVHEKVRDNKEFEYLCQFDGSIIHLPDDRKLWPDQEAIRFHRDNVFGMFCR